MSLGHRRPGDEIIQLFRARYPNKSDRLGNGTILHGIQLF